MPPAWNGMALSFVPFERVASNPSGGAVHKLEEHTLCRFRVRAERQPHVPYQRHAQGQCGIVFNSPETNSPRDAHHNVCQPPRALIERTEHGPTFEKDVCVACALSGTQAEGSKTRRQQDPW